jgi:Glycosyltransferases involved in cell wall biogenesis
MTTRPAVESIALMIPTLNEIDGLRVTLPEIDRSLFSEIIVTDGGSTDGTVEFCREQGLQVVIQPGRGVPDAEECAFKLLKSDAVITYTPDGNSLASLLPRMCELLRQDYDMVIASRYKDDATSEDDDFVTSIGNAGFTAAVNVLFRAKYTDSMVGLRGYRCDAVRKMRLVGIAEENWLRRRFFQMNSWELGSSMRAARLKLKVVEIPGPEPKRIGGDRKMSVIKNGTGAALQVLNDFFCFWG